MRNIMAFSALFHLVGSTALGQDTPSDALRESLRAYPHRIICESNREGNWELYLMGADGSKPVNLTRTPEIDEVYAKASPDGSRICFVGDQGEGKERIRRLYLMNTDGTGRRQIAERAREHCWNADGTRIAYLRDELRVLSVRDGVTKGLSIYDVASGETRPHPNREIEHLYTLNWSPDGRWFVATVHGGMGFKHSIIALEAEGDGVYDLKLRGCRPDLSPDGTKVVWCHGDHAVGLADMDWSGRRPIARNIRNLVEVEKPLETYHADWSPDGRYVAFSHGPKMRGKSLRGLMCEFPGVRAPGWNICLADASRRNVWIPITTDGESNKEPDWVAADR